MMREDWVETELGKVCEFVGGGTPSKKEPSYWNGDIPWASIKDIKGGYLTDTKDCITEKGLQNSAANLAQPEEIILATRINPGRPIRNKIRAAINQDLKIVKPRIDIDNNFLYYTFLNLEGKILKVSSGTTVLGINLNNLRDIIFPLAPLLEQRAIVAKIEKLFSDLDNGIANLKTAKAKLDIYRQAVLKKAFEGELTRAWREKQAGLPTAENLLKQINAERLKYYESQLRKWEQALKVWEARSKKGNKPKNPKKLESPDKPNTEHLKRMWALPKQWVWTQLGFLAFVTKLAGFEYTKYVHYNESGDLAVIKAENAGLNGFKPTEFSRIKSETVSELIRSQIFGGELLIVFVGAGTGNVAVVPKNGKYFLGPNIGMARPYFNIDTRYLELFLRSAMGKNLMMAAVKAVAQPSLSMGTIRQAPIAFPSSQEQTQIVIEIESRLSVCDKLAESIDQSLEKSEALRQSILKKAFAGQLLSEAELESCRQEPDWEPAHKLLERIKKDKAVGAKNATTGKARKVNNA